MYVLEPALKFLDLMLHVSYILVIDAMGQGSVDASDKCCGKREGATKQANL
jgi:hypothetical protein